LIDQLTKEISVIARLKVMANTKVNPEVVRLTRRTAEQQQLPFFKQAARCVAEQAIMDLDPELGFLLESDQALSSVDAMVRSAQVNDIVVNSRHVDVALLEDGEVRLPNWLARTSYIECGSLVVAMSEAGSGSVVGHIDGPAWEAACEGSGNQFEVSIKFSAPASFDLADCLQQLETRYEANVDKAIGNVACADEVLQFVRSPRELDLQTQRRVISSAIASSKVRDSIGALDNFSSDHSPRVLRDSGVWESRIQRIANKIAAKYPNLDRKELEKAIRETGEDFGGQADAPAFKQALSKRVTRLEVARKTSAAVREMLNPFMDSVAAGKGAAESIKGMIKDKVAVDVARVIKEKRRALGQFAAATADEIGFAFQQLALQPAYATHSQSEGGVDSINEALQLLETAAVMENLLEMDFDA
jgi:hypothetical protein